MPDRHKRQAISIRPSPDDREWLERYAAETGRTMRAVIAEALAEYRQRKEAEAAVSG